MRDFPTVELKDAYVSYTCQSIDDKKLAKNNIEKIGKQFGIEAREVLLVPKETLAKKWYFPKSPADAQALIESMIAKKL